MLKIRKSGQIHVLLTILTLRPQFQFDRFETEVWARSKFETFVTLFVKQITVINTKIQ